MSHYPAKDVISPKNKWELKSVLYDAGSGRFAIASGYWKGRSAIGIRWNGSHNEGLGLGTPNSFGRPIWFILPEELTPVILASLENEDIWNSEFKNLDSVKTTLEDLAEGENQELYWLPKATKKKQDKVFFCHALVLGGGDKPPLARFMDLVAKVHKNCRGKIKEVIVTDPYVLSDVGETGSTSGYNNLCLYLKTLGIMPDDKFKLTITPSPKMGGNSLPIFERKIKSNYPNLSLCRFSPTLTFHDRIYLVRRNKSQIKGVFGPSLNGLNASDFVLMGEVKSESLSQLSKLFG